MEASMAIDVYLQIDGIRGESADSERRYTQQRIAGGAGGNTAGGWDLASNRVA
jgi:type VI protein secretion system component Hcp